MFFHISDIILSSIPFCLFFSIALGFYPISNEKRGRLWFYIASIVLGVSIKVVIDLNTLPTSLYTVLGVAPTASVFDIRRAFKELSLLYHPDKSPSENSQSHYYAIRYAYDQLVDDSKRDCYDRFGAIGLVSDPRNDEIDLLFSIAIIYIYWIVVLLLVTSPSSSRSARTPLIVVLLVMLVLEVTLRTTSTRISDLLPLSITEHELLVYAHMCFPGLLLIIKCVMDYYYLDVDKYALQFAKTSSKNNKEMLTLMRETASLLPVVENDASTSSETQNVRTNLMAISERIQENDREAARLVAALESAAKSSSSGSYLWVLFIIVYLAYSIGSE